MEDFNNMFEENDNEILKMQQEAENQIKMSAIKDQLARSNYNAIIEHGIDIDALEDPKPIKHIINETLQHFEDLEEYEKCAKLKLILDSF